MRTALSLSLIVSVLSGTAGCAGRHRLEAPGSAAQRDHADHRSTGRLAASIAKEGGFGLSQYAGYSTSEWPSNLQAAQFAQKAALFMAYDRARLLANPDWSAYAELPAGYSSWLSRTYVRPAGFTGRSR